MQISLKQFLKRNYDLQALEINELVGYDSENYRVRTKDKTFVLKIHKNEDNLSDLLNAETSLLKILSDKKPESFPVPQRDLNGNYLIEKSDSIWRLLSFIEGDFFGDVEHTDELFYSFGKFLAEMNLQTSSEMLKINGVGDVKLEKYGMDFLQIIVEYCELNDLDSRIDLKTPKRPAKKQRVKRNAKGESTYSITLEMFRNGASIEEIAQRRELGIGTIETHLVRYIPSGEVKLTDIVPEEKIETIRNAIIEMNAEQGIGPIKEFLGEDYSYGKIRAVVADFMRIANAVGN